MTADGSGSVLGNAFYKQGIVTITNTGSMYSGVGLGTGSDGFEIDFKSTVTIYEHEYVCTIQPNEFTHTTNISAAVGRSGSVYIPTDTNIAPYKFFAPGDNPQGGSGSFASFYNPGEYYINSVTHSEWSPYVTTVGLYNDDGQLLAAGKLARPLKNDPELALSVIVRFDA